MTPEQQKRLEMVQQSLNNYRVKRFGESFKNSKDLYAFMGIIVENGKMDEALDTMEKCLNKSFRD